MSQENVEIVRSIYAAWERGDFSATEWLHPEIEFAMVGGPSPGIWTGLAGMAAATHEFLSAWLIHHRGRGKTSGLELGQMHTKNAALFHVRDGKVTRFVAYWDRERALADLGLSEQDAHAE
jgi:ketosteroid isomerase-like protein